MTQEPNQGRQEYHCQAHGDGSLGWNSEDVQEDGYSEYRTTAA
jgi:hypothetical protein